MSESSTGQTPQAPATPRGRRWLPLWVVLAAAVPGLLNLIPIAAGYAFESPPERVFLGFRYAVPDHAQYMAMLTAAAEGDGPALANPFVTEPQDGRFVMLYIWALGQLQRLSGADPVRLWHALGLGVSWLFFVAVWLLVRRLFADPLRRLAYLLACFGGGLDWVLVALRAWGSGLSNADASYYFFNWSSFGAAHLPMWLASYGLVLLALLLTLRLLEGLGASTSSLPWPAQLLGAGVLIPLAFTIHPYTALVAIPTLVGLAGLPWLSRWRGGETSPAWSAGHSAAALAVACIATACIGGLALWARQDAVYAATAESFFTWHERYSMLSYPLLYGLLLPLGLWGLVSVLGQRPQRPGQLLLVAWLISAWGLSNAPWFAGAKFQYTAHLPLALLAATGLEDLCQRWPWMAALRRQRLAALLFWVAVATSPLLTPLRDLPQTSADPIYASQPQLDMLAELRAMSDGNVVAPPSVAIVVPWKGGKPVYDGHWYLSYGHSRRLDQLKRFYHPRTDPAWRLRFLDSQRITYILTDPWTREGLGRAPEALGFVQVHSNDFGQIWARSQQRAAAASPDAGPATGQTP